MENIIANELRVGRFTSSEIYRLMTLDRSGKNFGDKARTYINEKKIERRMGRSVNLGGGSRSTAWGNFLEQRVHELIGIDYITQSKRVMVHPEYSFWSGSPDCINERESVVGDIKCYEPKNFAEYIDCLLQNDIELFKAEFPQQYWQLISNSDITGMSNIEAIVYMPYESELQTIRDMAYEYDDYDQYKYRFISEADKSELPYLPDGGYYKNLNIFRFEAPKEDIKLLRAKVVLAEQEVLKP